MAKSIPPEGTANEVGIFEDAFNTFVFLRDEKTIDFLKKHGKIVFIIRGPPGSGKTALSNLLIRTYPSSVLCCADHYFIEEHIEEKRDRGSLGRSHEYCFNKMQKACDGNVHPIIVQNSHMKRWEVKQYVDCAVQKQYTIVMGITMRKLYTSVDDLERYNVHGLKKDYLNRRMKQWQEYIPEYLGWFICPIDESCIFNEAKNALSDILEDNKFCKDYEIYSQEKIWDRYILESQLFCIASFCNGGKVRGTTRFYTSSVVQNVYGKSFPLHIYGFLIMPNAVLAVVLLTKEMQPLIFPKSNPRDMKSNDLGNTLASALENLTIGGAGEGTGPKETFTNTFDIPKTPIGEEYSEVELPNINSISFIPIAMAKEKCHGANNVVQFAAKVFSDIQGENGVIDTSQFLEFDDGTRYSQLQEHTWFLVLNKKVIFPSVLTGLYV